MQLEKSEIVALMMCIVSYENSNIDISDSFNVLLQKCKKKLEEAAHEPDRKQEALRLIENLHELVRRGV